jgi:sulfate transport system ATP-binding protein
MGITCHGVTKRFGAFTALDDVSLDVPGGELLALLGPSGSGKTTLLRIIAGLEVPDAGYVARDGEDMTRKAVKDRGVGFVFQHYALFRHMTVAENIGFGLRLRKTSRKETADRVAELLSLVRLEGLARRYPSQLSGGQRQRVALARALAVRPALLLLDEPFGALDAKVRQELRQWLRRLHEQMHVTTILVTHDQEEAFEVADRVVIMQGGQVEQTGTPQQVFDEPANPFVLDFLGNVNVFHGRVEGGKAFVGGFEVACPSIPSAIALSATAYVRPHELDLEREPRNGHSLPVRVVQVNPAGSTARVRLRAAGSEDPLHVDLSYDRYTALGIAPGQQLYAVPRRVRVFFPDSSYPEATADYSI